VKFLLDENLSPRLINRLDQLFPGLAHVGQFGLKRSGDIVIFEWAKANEFGVITTDADFVALAQRLAWPPKVIHLEQCDYPLRVIEDLLRRSPLRITEFAKDDRVGLLVLRFATNLETR
jgi:predicted nuclease of predicted toxin-antitoxin system